MTPPRVLVCGSRNWRDGAAILADLSAYPPGTVVIQGCANGADLLACGAAKRLGFTVESYPADWNQHGKAAGPLRNQRMLDEGKPTEGIAYVLPSSRGTWDMIRRLRAAGIPVRIVKKERQ